MSHLVIDVGTSGVRALVVRPDATIAAEHYEPTPPATPFPGWVELDASAMAATVLRLAHAALHEAGPVASLGIANQRASTIVWDRATGQPVGPGVGWQDLRTAGMCLMLAAQGIRVAPNASATKLVYLLDTYDAERKGNLCFGTVDSWVAWTLSQGSLHVTDATNAAITGLAAIGDGVVEWSPHLLEALNVPVAFMPQVVDSTGVLGPATALPGAPLIAGMAGDQQASMIGQGCVRPGMAKITFGTGGMLDLCTGTSRMVRDQRGAAGTFPIVAWQRSGALTWGVEAIMLTAGSCIDWLRDDLRIIESSADSADVAGLCENSGGVWFVPALLGLGTPDWDYGARGTILGLTRGSGRPEIVRAVLEGIAHRGVDLVEAAEQDSGMRIEALRMDGGMSSNPVFVQAVADAAQRPVEVSPVLEATALGAGFLAGLATGTWSSLDDVAAAWRPARTVQPRSGVDPDRDRWIEARERSRRWIPELSAIDF